VEWFGKKWSDSREMTDAGNHNLDILRCCAACCSLRLVQEIHESSL